MQLIEQLAPYAEIIFSLGIFVLSLVIAKAAVFILGKLEKKIAGRTETILDDLLIHSVRRPLALAIIIIGLFTSAKFFPGSAVYLNEINLTFLIGWIVIAAYFIVKVADSFFDWYMKEISSKTNSKLDDQFFPIFRKIIAFIVYGVALVWILNQLGLEITTLIAALGVGGLAIALAMQDTLSNFIAGAHMVLDRPIKIKDYIELENGLKGYVEDVGWRSTRIRTWDNNLVIIPNKKLSESILINYFSPSQPLLFKVEVGVSYGSDLEKVEKVCKQVGGKVMEKFDVKFGPEEYPVIRYSEFGDSSIHFGVILKVNEYGQKFVVKHEFIKALKKEFDRKKIEIPFPCTNVYMRK